MTGPRQLPLDLPHVPSLARHDFLVSDCNRAAWDAIQNPGLGPAGRMVLTGPQGCGKTHLAAIWAAVAGGIRREKHNRLRLVASRDAADGSLLIHQDARIYLSNLDEGHSVHHGLEQGRHAWLQVLRGAVTLNDQALTASDGAAVSEEVSLEIVASQPAEIMLFDLR